jgi:hypothetical protein
MRAVTMSGRDKDTQKSIKIKRPKRRVKTPLKTGTVVHKSRKTYTRQDKHKKEWEDSEEEEPP